MKLLACAVAVLAVSAVVAATDVTVDTSLGKVVGTLTATHQEYRGVPFATPPVGDLRWQTPTPVKAWGTLEAKADKPGCWQNCSLPEMTCPPVMSEDCLYANIFAPADATPSSNLPVMIFIHGGNFKQGYAGGLLYNGGPMANNTDVVVVVVQYRLGSLGFLSTGDTIQGNYGLQDQRLAMKFVAQNIASFGGNPDSVTLFGQSAGAMSIASHISSPLSKGLFHRAILESEPFGLPFRTPDTWKSFAKAFSKYAGCEDDSSRDTCLKGKTPQEIISAQTRAEHDLLVSVTHILEIFLPWTPTAGVAELPYQPWDAWVGGNTNDVPIIIGTVENEGWEFVYEAFGKSLSALEMDLIIDAAFGVGHSSELRKQYPPVSGSDNRPIASKLATDGLFVCATRNASLSGPVARSSPVYLYHFDHVMSFSKAVWGKNFAFCDDKVCHAEELVYVFGVQNSTLGVVFTADEVVLSDSMQYYWSNFAATGNPNTPPSADKLRGSELSWPSLSSEEKSLQFATPANTILTAPYRSTCSLWDTFGYNFA